MVTNPKNSDLDKKLKALKAAWVRGETKGWSKAAKWLRKAAEQGNAEAQLQIGRLYGTGYGLKENQDEATKWYRKAAKNGSPDAQYTVGRMYEWGVKRDLVRALKWYRNAAKQGHKEAQRQVRKLMQPRRKKPKKRQKYKSPFMVGLYLHGDKLEPQVITSRLKVSPTDSHRKGETRKFKDRDLTRKSGMWHLEARSRSQNLSDHIDELASKIKGSGKGLKRLPGVERGYIDIWIGYARNQSYKSYKGHKSSDRAWFEFTDQNIEALGRFGLPVQFTLSISDD